TVDPHVAALRARAAGPAHAGPGARPCSVAARCTRPADDPTGDSLMLQTSTLRCLLLVLLMALAAPVHAQQLLVPMDDAQRNHLKAYGVMYGAPQAGLTGEWLLNYRGGSFLLPDDETIRRRAALDGVVLEPVNG